MNPSTKLVSELSCVRRLDRRPMLEISMHWPSQILHFTTCLPLLLVCKLRLQEKGISKHIWHVWFEDSRGEEKKRGAGKEIKIEIYSLFPSFSLPLSLFCYSLLIFSNQMEFIDSVSY